MIVLLVIHQKNEATNETMQGRLAIADKLTGRDRLFFTIVSGLSDLSAELRSGLNGLEREFGLDQLTLNLNIDDTRYEIYHPGYNCGAGERSPGVIVVCDDIPPSTTYYYKLSFSVATSKGGVQYSASKEFATSNLEPRATEQQLVKQMLADFFKVTRDRFTIIKNAN